MPAIALPDPPPSDGVVALRAYADADVPALVAIAHARGRGIATRAVELVAGWAFGTLGLVHFARLRNR